MNKPFHKIAAIIMAAYLVIAVGFYLIAGEQLHYEDVKSSMLSPSATVGEIVIGTEVRQLLPAKAAQFLQVTIRVSNFARENTAHLNVAIVTQDGTELYSATASAEEIVDYGTLTFVPEEAVLVPAGQRCELVITSPDGVPGNAVTVLAGSSVSAGKAQIEQKIPAEERVTVDGEPMEARLCCQVSMRNKLSFGDYYWYYAAALGLLLGGYLLHMAKLMRDGRSNWLLDAWAVVKKYEFLIRQLVGRDFKTRYKRSVLGVVWSFLNPLMTMMVQYVVFSTLFRSDIEKFPLYLLTGIITFNFFNESTSETSQSIVKNTPLITKVYIPKLIYPVASVMVSTINLLISFILQILVMFLTRTPLTPAFLLVPFGVICLACFCTGVGLILASYMVFFKDIQFLWNVFTMLWMYATPIFYPETIIPENFLPIYRMNPLYQFVTFFRTIMIQGISPSPSKYLYCILCAVIPLALGLYVFHKKQDQFIFNL